MGISTVKTIFAEKALTGEGWRTNVKIEINEHGVISSVANSINAPTSRYGILLPSPANLHSHAFQRAMAGLTEFRRPNTKNTRQSSDSFWTWRELMYRFVAALTPEDVESIAAFVQMEMLQAGYASVGEFHYLHHQPSGQQYDDIGEMSARIAAAANNTGIGLTLLPVLYQQAGCNGGELNERQKRFGNTLESFSTLLSSTQKSVQQLADDARVGIAPHSLRAVNPKALAQAVHLIHNAPIHIHIAEQLAEIEEVQQHFGQRPVEYLLSHYEVNEHWCLVHATHMTAAETSALAQSKAVAGICPITEANLGDGIFDGARFLENHGRFGIGSDSNVRITLTEELRLLEYSQRLKSHQRAVLATNNHSTGRTLYEKASSGGAQAIGRNSGVIEEGYLADLIALDASNINLLDREGNAILDSFIFASDDRLIRDVWSAGRHVVTEGRHKNHRAITESYRKTIQTLRNQI